YPECIGGAKVALVGPIAAKIRHTPFPCSTVIDLVRPNVFFEIAGGIQHGSGFEQCDADAQASQHLYHGASAGAGTDNYYVVDGRSAACLHYGKFRLSTVGVSRRWCGFGGASLTGDTRRLPLDRVC